MTTVIKDPDMLFLEVAKMAKKLGKYFNTTVIISAQIGWHVYTLNPEFNPSFGEPEWLVWVHNKSKIYNFDSWDKLKYWARNLKKVDNMKTTAEKIGLQK